MFSFADTITKVDTMKVVKVDSIQVETQITESVNESVLSYFLNGIDTNYFIALFIFGLLGALLNLLFNISDRDKESQRTPEKFSLLFLIKDNIVRFSITILLIYFGIIFSEYLFGVVITIQLAVCLGFSLDSVSELVKNKFKIQKKVDTPIL
jgi:hypothetical protein